MTEKDSNLEENSQNDGKKALEGSKKNERKDRLAVQLRENLLRRKHKEKQNGNDSDSDQQ